MTRLPQAATALMIAVGVVACGGGAVAVLGAIGAAGGDFTLDDDPATPELEVTVDPLNPLAGARRISIQPDVPANSFDNFFEPSFKVFVQSGSLGGPACNGATGTISGMRLDLGDCFTGRFDNVNRVVADRGGRVLLFGSFQPSMNVGIWVDVDDETHRYKFEDDDTGCEIDASGPTGRSITLTQVDADLRNGVYNSVRDIRVGSRTWTTGEYLGVSGLRLSGGAPALALERRRDTTTSCPAP